MFYLESTQAARPAVYGRSGGAMLQNIRDNSQSWIAKTIVGLIVVLMAFTGFEAIVNSGSNRNNAALVNGAEITLDQLTQAADMQRRQLQQQLGKDFDASLLDDKLLRESALKGLIDRQLLLQGAADAGFAFSDAAIDQLILLTPEFQVDGQFNADRFDQVIRQMGFDRLRFRQMLREEMLIGQLRAGLAGSAFVTDAEIKAFARLDRQTRDFAYLTVVADRAAVSVSDEQVESFYKEHEARFMTPEQVTLEYVELKKDAFFDQVDVNEDDLQALYQKEIANLAEQRQAAHILVEVNAEQDEAKARTKIEQLAERIAKGEDFAALARDFSADTGSAAEGGDLGFAGPGVYDPAFEEALYGLQLQEVSAPVRTEFGFHLIKLLGVQAPEVPAFAELREKLERELKTQQVEQRFVEAVKQLEDSAFEASDLHQPAQEMDLAVLSVGPFGREGGEGLAANRQVVQAAFSSELLEDGANSSAIELDPSTVVVVRVKQHLKPQPQALADVQAEIRQQLEAEQAAKQAEELAGQQLEALRKGATPQDQAQAWTILEAAGRAQEGVAPAILQAVFRMQRPQSPEQPVFTQVALSNGDQVLVRLNGVNDDQGELQPQELAMYRQFLASRVGQEDFAAYRRQLQASAEIERF